MTGGHAASLLTAAVALGCASAALSAPVPFLNVADLEKQADLIVVGRVESIAPFGRTVIARSPDSTEPASVMLARIHIDDVLKGDAGIGSIDVPFIAPEYASSGYGSLEAGTYRVVFLRRANDSVELANPFHPSAPAAPGPRAQASTPFERVVEVMRRVLTPMARYEMKREALAALFQVQHPAALEALRPVLQDPDRRIRVVTIAALLEMHDPSAVAFAESLLRGPEPHPSEDLELRAVQLALRQVRDPVAVPALVRLAGAGAVATRRSAVEALGFISSPDALPVLVRSLEDRDPEVRMTAMRSLARMTGQPSHVLSSDAFESREVEELQFWRDWARRRGIGK